jgi:hypothetical protein
VGPSIGEYRGAPGSVRTSVVAAGIGLIALASAEVWSFHVLWQEPPPAWMLSGLAGGLLFGASGVAAWWLRPESRSGLWMVLFAVLRLLLQVEVPPKSRYAGPAAVLRVVVIFLLPSVGAHLILGFPTGRLPGVGERRVVRAAFLVGLERV